MNGPTILCGPNGRTRPTSKPPRSLRRWSITRCSMSEQPREDTERQGSKVLPVIGQLDAPIRPMAPNELDGHALLWGDPQTDFFVEIPPGRRQTILLGFVRRAQRRKKCPMSLWEQLQPARQGEAPVGIREMNINAKGGVVEVLPLGEPECTAHPAIVIERDDDGR